MKILLTIIILLSAFTVRCQTALSIAHYQRNATAEELVLPGNPYKSSDLIIMLSDSLYDSGTIQINKLKINGLVLKKVAYTFVNDTINEFIFSVKGKRRFQELYNTLENSFENIPKLGTDKISIGSIKKSDRTEVLFEYVKIKNRYYFSIKKS